MRRVGTMRIREKVCRVRIRPDLASRVIPGYPWNRVSYLAWRAFLAERATEPEVMAG